MHTRRRHHRLGVYRAVERTSHVAARHEENMHKVDRPFCGWRKAAFPLVPRSIQHGLILSDVQHGDSLSLRSSPCSPFAATKWHARIAPHKNPTQKKKMTMAPPRQRHQPVASGPEDRLQQPLGRQLLGAGRVGRYRRRGRCRLRCQRSRVERLSIPRGKGARAARQEAFESIARKG